MQRCKDYVGVVCVNGYCPRLGQRNIWNVVTTLFIVVMNVSFIKDVLIVL